MEIALVIGILAAFALGAYIRQPFQIFKRAAVPPPPAPPKGNEDIDRQKKEEGRIQQLNNMMNYTGKEQSGED